jgi:hypothetical protein
MSLPKTFLRVHHTLGRQHTKEENTSMFNEISSTASLILTVCHENRIYQLSKHDLTNSKIFPTPSSILLLNSHFINRVQICQFSIL